MQPPPALLVYQGQRPLAGVPVRLVARDATVEVAGHYTVTDQSGRAEFPSLVIRSLMCEESACDRITFDVRAGRTDSLMRGVSLSFQPTLSGPTALTITAGGTEARLGSVLSPGIQVRALVDTLANTVARQVPVVVLDEHGDKLDEQTTNDYGIAVFTKIRPHGQLGPQRLLFVSGTAQRAYDVRLIPGKPTKMALLTSPPPRLRFDSLWATAPVVQVTDTAGNPVPNVAVRATLCNGNDHDRAPTSLLWWLGATPDKSKPHNGSESRTCILNPQLLASLGGTTLRVTDTAGRAVFDGLSFRGRAGTYEMRFQLGEPYSDVAPLGSIYMIYAPKRDYDQNFVFISAIKTIAGEPPDHEFFDLRFRFRLGTLAHVLANTDISLSGRDSKDSVRSSQKLLTEAALQLNGNLYTVTERTSEIPQRLLFAGAQLKVFNTAQYYGVHLGGMEMGGSPFRGSSLSVAILHRWSADSVRTEGSDAFVPARYSLGVDYFLRSPRMDFFRTLTIRGSILVPFGVGGQPSTRIAIAVPLGELAW